MPRFLEVECDDKERLFPFAFYLYILNVVVTRYTNGILFGMGFPTITKSQ